MFITLKPFDERRKSSNLTADADGGHAARQIQKEILEARIDVFGAPAVDGLGNAGGFQLMIEAIGDVDFRALQGQADNICQKGSSVAGRGGHVQRLSSQHAAALYRHRSDQGQDDEAAAERRVRHAAGVPRRLLYERLQSLRPDVAGQSAGRCAVPSGCRYGEATQMPELGRRNGAARVGREHSRFLGTAGDHTIQHVSGGDDQRGGEGGREHRGRAERRWRAVRS